MVYGGGRLCRRLQKYSKNGGVGSVISTHTVKSVSGEDKGGGGGLKRRAGELEGEDCGEYVDSWGNGDLTRNTGTGAKTHGVGIDG